MYVNQLTNETYIDRKEAKISLGTSNFNRLLKKEDYLFYQRTTICQLWDTE